MTATSQPGRLLIIFVAFLVSILCFDLIKGIDRLPGPLELIVGAVAYEFAAVLGVMSVLYTLIGLFTETKPFENVLKSHTDQVSLFFLAFLTCFAGLDILLSVLTGGVPLP